MKVLNSGIVAVVLFCFSLSASATWRVHQHHKHDGWIVTNGDPGQPGTTHVEVKSEKQGKKLAKKLNKIEEQDKKDADGVVDFGDCPDQPGVVC